MSSSGAPHPASMPLLPPIPEGQPVTPALIAWIEDSDMSPAMKADVVSLVRARYDYGLQKYGQALMTEDRRDDVVEALQELGDLLQYAFKARLNGRQAEAARALAPGLAALVRVLQYVDT